MGRQNHSPSGLFLADLIITCFLVLLMIVLRGAGGKSLDKRRSIYYTVFTFTVGNDRSALQKTPVPVYF